jgi:hypothetical protein
MEILALLCHPQLQNYLLIPFTYLEIFMLELLVLLCHPQLQHSNYLALNRQLYVTTDFATSLYSHGICGIFDDILETYSYRCCNYSNLHC